MAINKLLVAGATAGAVGLGSLGAVHYVSAQSAPTTVKPAASQTSQNTTKAENSAHDKGNLQEGPGNTSDQGNEKNDKNDSNEQAGKSSKQDKDHVNNQKGAQDATGTEHENSFTKQ